MSRSPAAQLGVERKRCAIYTRKSTDEGLEQDFNSLDAQREAAEAFIASQRQEGWVALPTRYDDGGYSGGSMERPALQRLLRAVEDGKIDVVVVYKVDRLSRSLLDFSKLVELFDRHRVSFISVTQHFNTTDSMGRLTLNILLSFAQFEREIIAERIRDKIAAAKRRGKQCGGRPVLGYDLVDGKLVINPEEAQLVRHIFQRFLRMGSATQLAKEFNEQGHTTKSWTTKRGEYRAGNAWNKSHLYRMLDNRKYLGEVTHKGQVYPGEHEAIISREVWDKVRSILDRNHRGRAARTRAKTPALLKGIIRCGHCGNSMGITFTRKDGKLYRYYLCVHASKNGYASCPVKSVAAGEMEEAVMGQLRAVFRSPELIAKTYRAARSKEAAELEQLRREKGEIEDRLRVLKEMAAGLKRGNGRGASVGNAATMELARITDQIAEAESRLSMAARDLQLREQTEVTERDVIDALQAIEPVWDELFPAEQARVVQLLVESVVVNPDGLEVTVRSNGLHSLIAELNGALSAAQKRSSRT